MHILYDLDIVGGSVFKHEHLLSFSRSGRFVIELSKGKDILFHVFPFYLFFDEAFIGFEFAKYMYACEHRILIATPSGIKRLRLSVVFGKIFYFQEDLGLTNNLKETLDD